jgi:hypothetical protein
MRTPFTTMVEFTGTNIVSMSGSCPLPLRRRDEAYYGLFRETEGFEHESADENAFDWSLSSDDSEGCDSATSDIISSRSLNYVSIGLCIIVQCKFNMKSTIVGSGRDNTSAWPRCKSYNTRYHYSDFFLSTLLCLICSYSVHSSFWWLSSKAKQQITQHNQGWNHPMDISRIADYSWLGVSRDCSRQSHP